MEWRYINVKSLSLNYPGCFVPLHFASLFFTSIQPFLHYLISLHTSCRFNSLSFTSCHNTSFLIACLPFPSIQFTSLSSLCFMSFYFSLLHVMALHFLLLHFPFLSFPCLSLVIRSPCSTSLHFTSFKCSS